MDGYVVARVQKRALGVELILQRVFRTPRVGMLLRNKNVHNPVNGAIWSSSLLFALVQELTALWDAENASIDGESGVGSRTAADRASRR